MLRQVTVLLSVVFSTAALGHGGVSMEDDTCVINISGMRAHFTGYQPEERATQEFCEDIPELGKAIIVVDFIERRLRGMNVEFRVLRDVNGVGKYGTYEDLGDAAEIEKNTLVNLPSAKYPRGTLTFTHSFIEPGWYIGMLTAQDGETVHRSVFPFQVGVPNYTGYIIGFILAFGVSLLVYIVTGRSVVTSSKE